MHTVEYECPQVSLVSWAQTARPVRLGAPSYRETADERAGSDFEPTDDYLFGFSTAALFVAPFALLALVVFG